MAMRTSAGSLGAGHRDAAGPTERDRQALLAGHRRPWSIAAACVAVPLAIAIGITVVQYMRWQPLLQTGVQWPAEVVSARNFTRAPDRIRVAFALPDGRLIEAGIPVSNASRHPVGSTVVVVFDNADPSHVRTLHGWSPPYMWPALFAFLIGSMLLCFLWHGWRWPRRLWAAATSPSRETMVLRTVDVVGRLPTTWALLSPPEARPGERPRYAFRLSDRPERPTGPVLVEVSGRVRPGEVAVMWAPEGPIWPATKLKRPSRQVRHALERQTALATFDGNADVGPTTRERVRPAAMPADPFETKDPKTPNSLWKVASALVPALLVCSLPLLVPALVDARRVCAVPPTAGTGDVGPVTPAALPSLLPSSLPGLTIRREEALTLGSFANPPTQLALVDADFQHGFERIFETGRTTVKMEVFQFASAAGPGRYEAQRLATLCTMDHDDLAVPRGSGASGTVTLGEFETRRYTIIRGSRDFVINASGPRMPDETTLLPTMTATAR